jgi:gamma-glutamylcyclotransferase (GGCT)/AIG2-like uncharacterized protein YtfP
MFSTLILKSIMKQNKHLYFAYGMNTNVSGMRHRCPAAISMGSSALLNYDFRFAHHADVVPQVGAKTVGVLWEITDQCLESLDRLEGYPTYYDRKIVQVLHKNEIYDALVYFMQPGSQEASPGQSYWDCLIEGYKEHDVSAAQLHRALRRSQDSDREYYARESTYSI